MKPAVLLTQKYKEDADHFGDGVIYCLKSSYAQAISRAGGAPLLSAGGDPEEYARLADGIIFTGGIDIEPIRYGQKTLTETVVFDRNLDEMEIRLYQAFASRKKPIFGICRGIQTINVAAGGTLWQDITVQLNSPDDHRTEKLREKNAHWVQTTPGSLIGKLIGDRAPTNSYHHQAVRDCAPGFQATARTADGVIEAIEHRTLPIFAVQWHPERMIGDERGDLPDMSSLFRHFVSICADGM